MTVASVPSALRLVGWGRAVVIGVQVLVLALALLVFSRSDSFGPARPPPSHPTPLRLTLMTLPAIVYDMFVLDWLYAFK